MIFVWNRKEIYNGDSMNEVNRIKKLLSEKGIDCEVKVLNTTTTLEGDTTNERIDSMGENNKYSYEYYMYVSRSNYDEAIYIINK